MPKTKRKPASKPKPKALAIQMSTQAKMFLGTLSPEERDGVLDVIGKIATGKLKGKRVDWSKLPEDVKQSIEASSRELDSKAPIRA